jgi:hypothetical protein
VAADGVKGVNTALMVSPLELIVRTGFEAFESRFRQIKVARNNLNFIGFCLNV